MFTVSRCGRIDMTGSVLCIEWWQDDYLLHDCRLLLIHRCDRFCAYSVLSTEAFFYVDFVTVDAIVRILVLVGLGHTQSEGCL